MIDFRFQINCLCYLYGYSRWISMCFTSILKIVLSTGITQKLKSLIQVCNFNEENYVKTVFGQFESLLRMEV